MLRLATSCCAVAQLRRFHHHRGAASARLGYRPSAARAATLSTRAMSVGGGSGHARQGKMRWHSHGGHCLTEAYLDRH